MLNGLRLIIPAVIALAVGCTREAEHGAAGDTSATPRRPEPPTTSPATLNVTERGIGPLQAGMSVQEATAAVGGALTLPAGADAAGCSYAQWRSGPPGVRIMVEAGRVARVDVDSLGTTTVAGAQVGDTEASILALYNGRTTVHPHKYEQGGHYVTVVDRADTTFALVFETIGGRVLRYRAGQRPQVEYVEGCG